MSLDIKYPIKILKTKRRNSLSISIKENYIQVSSPLHLSEKKIFTILEKKKSWIEKKIEEKKKYLKKKCITFNNNSEFYFYGNLLKLKYVEGIEETLRVKNKKLVIITKKNILKKTIEYWYKKQILKYLKMRLYFYSKKMEVNFRKLDIRSYKRRLGSCSKSGDITFNWKIVMMPKKIIDYIVIHELCHLKHFNHSKKFWNEVEKYCPDYKVSVNWIKFNLNIITW